MGTYDELTTSSHDYSMDITKGVFTAPLAGTYVFSAHAVALNTPAITGIVLYIRENGLVVSYASDLYGNAAATVLLNLEYGDKVDVFISGRCTGNGLGGTQFSGFLLS